MTIKEPKGVDFVIESQPLYATMLCWKRLSPSTSSPTSATASATKTTAAASAGG